ncbi:hypothetical protein K8R30_02365 [archaeon]|nr:hypothetical protein [archaeon]
MGKKLIIGLCVGVVIIVLAVFSALSFKVDSSEDESEVIRDSVSTLASTPVLSPASTTPKTINYQKYNIDYMNDDIKNILVRQAGATGKTAFYLPPTGYINVSRGTKYGVAFLIQNVNPKVPEGNEFVYNFDVDPSSVGDCGVSADVAQSWIERGWTSSGMIAGQWREDWNEWHDAMTIYFAFPSDVEPCTVKYNFVITKDGVAYDLKTVEFNLI